MGQMGEVGHSLMSAINQPSRSRPDTDRWGPLPHGNGDFNNGNGTTYSLIPLVWSVCILCACAYEKKCDNMNYIPGSFWHQPGV